MERSIYEFPWLFRRVHMERPGEIAAEVKFLERTWRRHLRRPVHRVLDLACGDSPHGQLLAKRGIRVVGVDRAPAMIAAGRAAAGRDERVRLYRRRIERFRLPERLFDAAIFMSETFPVLTSNAALLGHLRSVAALLRRGGLYCIDIDRHDGIELEARRRLWRRRHVKAGPARVAIREFHRPTTWCSGLQSIYELECLIRFPDGAVTTRDVVPVRYIVPPVMELAAAASGRFRLIACYADLSFDRPIERCFGRWMAVLRRL